jgi:hypothetical protein
MIPRIKNAPQQTSSTLANFSIVSSPQYVVELSKREGKRRRLANMDFISVPPL